MSIEKCNSIKGLFTLIIVFSHLKQYITDSGRWYDTAYFNYLGKIGQLMVVMFLFYSGFGIMESVKNKANYIQSFPEKRIYKTWLNFAVAVFLFLIVDLLLGKNLSFNQVIFSFIGWDGIGNSNWFVFSILILYIFVYVSFITFKKHKTAALLYVTVLTMIFILTLREYREPYWYNTVMTLPIGMWYSFFREKIERVLFKYQIVYWVTLVGLILSFAVFYRTYLHMAASVPFKQPVYIVMACIFALMMAVLSMKLSFNNRALRWLGLNVFSIYITQRIPMILFSTFGLNRYIYVFVPLCTAVVLVCGWGFTKLLKLIDERLLS